MASSNAFVRAPSQNPSHENIVPLESVVTDQPSASHVRVASGSIEAEGLTRHTSTHALPSSHTSEREIAWKAMEVSQRAVLRRLKAWHQWDTDRYKSLSEFILSKARHSRTVR